MRRAVKILPPFLIAVIVPTVIYGFRYHVNAGDVLTQVFFVFNWIAYSDYSVLPGTGVMWSLAIEEQFYIVFAVLWALALRTGRHRTVMVWCSVVAIVVSVVSRLVLTTDAHGLDETPRIFFGTDTRLDSIALGVLTAFLYDAWARGEKPRGTSFIARDATCSSPWPSTSEPSPCAMCGSATRSVTRSRRSPHARSCCTDCCLVTGTVRTCVLPGVATNRLISLIGLASYSIYLVHETLGLWLTGSVLDGVLPGHPGPDRERGRSRTRHPAVLGGRDPRAAARPPAPTSRARNRRRGDGVAPATRHDSRASCPHALMLSRLDVGCPPTGVGRALRNAGGGSGDERRCRLERARVHTGR